jgi:rhodanese-related sulfurtransferase
MASNMSFPTRRKLVSEGPKIDEVSPQEATGRREKGAVLLDVREPDEWAAGHAPDAIHVPLAEVETTAARFAGQEVLAVCRSGGRSAKAAETLAQAGIEVRNVAGGMTAWAAAGLPVMRDDGAPGAVV